MSSQPISPLQARMIVHVLTSEKPVGTWTSSGNGTPEELITAMHHCLEYDYLRVIIGERNLPFLEVTDRGRQAVVNFVSR